jgi:hypothetical protein
MIRQHDYAQGYIHAQSYEYHTVSTEGLIAPEQRAELERYGWQCFSVVGPATADDRRYDYHFRRPLEPHRLRVRHAPGAARAKGAGP